MKLYLDMDGVLADFNRAARKALGTDNSYRWEFIHGSKKFWELIDADPVFWHDMEPMPDFHVLVKSIWHIDFAVLTALPKKNSQPVADAKRGWIKKHVGGMDVFTCLTSEKSNFCSEGDILIDDRNVNEKFWRDKGGRFILHRDAMSTVSILEDMQVI